MTGPLWYEVIKCETFSHIENPMKNSQNWSEYLPVKLDQEREN